MKWSDATYIEDQDQWWHGGITRSVYLYATPRVHLADVRVNAGLADDLRTGTFELLADVDFGGAEAEARLDGRGTAGRARAARPPSCRSRTRGRAHGSAGPTPSR